MHKTYEQKHKNLYRQTYKPLTSPRPSSPTSSSSPREPSSTASASRVQRVREPHAAAATSPKRALAAATESPQDHATLWFNLVVHKTLLLSAQKPMIFAGKFSFQWTSLADYVRTKEHINMFQQHTKTLQCQERHRNLS